MKKENITIINTYLIIDHQYIYKTVEKLKEKINISTIIVEDFNTPNNRLDNYIKDKYGEDLNNSIH